jgi:predicted NBD/HSP70 family sugar kinase
VENDARAAAHGAYTLARISDPQLRSLAYVSIGTGISAGFVLDGDLYRGSRGIAGEIGHVVADPAGPRCACGLAGCLEAIASGGSASGWGGDGHGMTTLFASAAAGDAVAVAAADRIAAALARALYGLVLSHDVERIVIGGGVIHHTPELVAAIGNAVSAIEAASPLAADLSPTSRISITDPSLPIGAIGAASLAARRWSLDGSAMSTELDHARQPH